MSFTNTLTQKWGEIIRKTRTDQGLSLEDVASRTGIDTSHLSRAERGLAGIGDESRMRLAAALGRRVEDLFPYPDTDTETSCRSAASATALGSSETPATAAATRSPARSAVAQDASAPSATPSTDEAVA